MSEARNSMNSAIQKYVLPVLRDKGFKGSFPHFRRILKEEIHLITFQFDKNGGAFVIELAKTDNQPLQTAWETLIEPSKITAHDLTDRIRLHPNGILKNSSTDEWFRYDRKSFFKFGIYKKIAYQVLQSLDLADNIWGVKQMYNKTQEPI